MQTRNIWLLKIFLDSCHNSWQPEKWILQRMTYSVSFGTISTVTKEKRTHLMCRRKMHPTNFNTTIEVLSWVKSRQIVLNIYAWGIFPLCHLPHFPLPLPPNPTSFLEWANEIHEFIENISRYVSFGILP